MPDIFEQADKQEGLNVASSNPQATPPVEEANKPEANGTKAYSERLNADRIRIEQKVRTETAQSFGYETWDEFIAAHRNKVIEDAGLDVAVAKPVIDKLVESNPDVLAAKRVLAEQENKAKDETISKALFDLNAKCGTKFTSIDEVDDATKALYEKGVPLDKAYRAEHFEELTKSVGSPSPTKGHLAGNNLGSGTGSPAPTITPQEMEVFRILNPSASDEDILKYVNSHK